MKRKLDCSLTHAWKNEGHDRKFGDRICLNKPGKLATIEYPEQVHQLMNKDVEAIAKLLAWLSHEPGPAVPAPSGESSNQGTDPDLSGSANLQSHNLDPLDSEELQTMPTQLSELGAFSLEELISESAREIPAVRDRFYALLKQRLRSEIEQKPPLFPWETELYDYADAEPACEPALVSCWMAQLQEMQLPVPMPVALLEQLFERCQQVVQSSLREGIKLVQVVESLFPGQAAALNQLASLVLAAPARSGAATASRIERLAESGKLPPHYESATPAQQMLLALLAAHEMLDITTLKLSSTQPQLEKQWQTPQGVVTLKLSYQSLEDQTEPHLRVQADLPFGGSLYLQGQMSQALAERSDAGCLSVELSGLSAGQVHALEIHLADANQPPLLLAVQFAAE